MLRPTPASSRDLECVASAIAEFQAHWEAIRPRPPFPCSFEGTRRDIDALDHLDYEGLPYPPSGIAGAALIWGNVAERRAGFRWHLDEYGDLLLCAPGEPSLVIWPYARVVEIQHGARPQFCKYQWLMEQVVVDCLGRATMDRADEARLIGMIEGPIEDGYARSLEAALRRYREVRG